MISSDFEFQVHKLARIPSTNSYALDFIRSNSQNEGLVFYTDCQESGKGQKGAVWHSEETKNLSFSLIIRPNLLVEEQFLISQVVALAMKTYLDSLAVGRVDIKWPNDLLINGSKVAGVLIENSIEGNIIRHSVIGVGLNVNQMEFPSFERAATSLGILSGQYFDLESVLTDCLKHLKASMLLLQISGKEAIRNNYLSQLYGFSAPVGLEDSKGTFEARISNVLPNGFLQLKREGELMTYDLKQLKFIS